MNAKVKRLKQWLSNDKNKYNQHRWKRILNNPVYKARQRGDLMSSFSKIVHSNN